MFDIFSTREIALGIYFLLIVIYALANAKIKKSVIDLIRCALTKKLVIPFLIMLIYAGLLIYLSTYFSFWKWKFIKDVILWVIFAGVPLCFNATSKTIEEHYFLKIITNNLKFTVLVEFIVSNFTFSIVIELILQLVLFILFMMQAIATGKDEYKSAKTFIDWIIVIMSVWILISTVNRALDAYAEQGIIDYIVTFAIPFVYSLLYVPVAYLMAIYSNYEILFVHMSFKEPEDRKIKKKHRFKIIKVCGLSYKKIRRFHHEYVKRLYIKMSENDFNKLINEFKSLK